LIICSGVKFFLTICSPLLSYFTNIITGLLFGGQVSDVTTFLVTFDAFKSLATLLSVNPSFTSQAKKGIEFSHDRELSLRTMVLVLAE